MRTLRQTYLERFARNPMMGVTLCLLFILGSIVLGTRNPLAFVSIEGLVIVAGGVIAVAFMSFGAEEVYKALETIRLTIERPKEPQHESLHRDMMEIIAWAYLVKEKGMRRLESSLTKSGIDDPFVKYGLNMVISGYTAEEVRAMMETAADAFQERDSIPVEVLETMTSHAPAFGMIGTLVGMVAMLCNLSDNVSSIGSSLSVSFLSTLYGVVSARLLYMPAAARLRQLVAERRFRNQLITEGMVMLVGNRNPSFIKDRLSSFLRPEFHEDIDQFKAEPPMPRLSTSHLKVIGA